MTRTTCTPSTVDRQLVVQVHQRHISSHEAVGHNLIRNLFGHRWTREEEHVDGKQNDHGVIECGSEDVTVHIWNALLCLMVEITQKREGTQITLRSQRSESSKREHP